MLASFAQGAILDLGGTNVTLHATNVLRTATVLVNGTCTATNGQTFLSFPTGTVTVASGARLVFPAEPNKNVFHNFSTGYTELRADGGEIELNSWREEENSGHLWAYALYKDVEAVIDVRNDGYFHCTKPGGPVLTRYYFILGYVRGNDVPVGILRGVDAPNRGFDFAGRLCTGWGAYAGIYCTNTLFRAENIVFGGVVPVKGGGYSEVVFAGGSMVETKGFCDGITESSADVFFDGATVRVRPTAADDALNAQTNFFGVAEGRIAYWLGPEGLTFDNAGNDVTIATTVAGSGGIVFCGAGETRLTAPQAYTGATVVAGGAFRPRRDLVFAGPVVVRDEAALERPPIPSDRNHVRLFWAAAFEGLSGRKDATGCHYFTLPGRYGMELHWGRRPGTQIKLR